MGSRRELTAAARGYSLDDVSAGLPDPAPVRGQLELPLPPSRPRPKERRAR